MDRAEDRAEKRERLNAFREAQSDAKWESEMCSQKAQFEAEKVRNQNNWFLFVLCSAIVVAIIWRLSI